MRIPFIVILALLASMVVLANLSESRSRLRSALYLMFVGLSIAYIYAYVTIPIASVSSPQNALVADVIAFITAALAILLLSEPVRRRMAGLFPSRQLGDIEGIIVGFDPTSMVHMTALILCLYLLSQTALTFTLAGGLTGLGRDFTGIGWSTLLRDLVTWVVFASLGAGLFIRRSFKATRQRLGLIKATSYQFMVASGVAWLLCSFAFVVGVAWLLLTPPEIYQQQNAVTQQINDSINNLPIAILVSITAAVGEEIAFRGALQPIFGLLPTAILFAAIHTQYTLTPAAGIIFVVALALGWLRREYGTTTSILAHFLYNFLPALVRLLPGIVYLVARIGSVNLPH